jgi:predicted alpha/beta-fold hydrolase
MPVLDANDYIPPLMLRNGHLNTFYPYLFRKKRDFQYTRQRIFTPDADFFDVDWYKNADSNKLVILLHGLEGSSDSQYITGTTRAVSVQGYHVAAINFRSCSGEMNLQMKMYHSGFTEDLHHFISWHTDNYSELYLCGFSLGGNVTMKYTGDNKYSVNPKIKAICGISVPCDLRAGSIKIRQFQNRLYEKKFLNTLKIKMKYKCTHFPQSLNPENINKIKSLWDFDYWFTAPLHGFADAEDYYTTCSSKQFLKNISIPALIINACDDSFLPAESYPFDEAKINPDLFLMAPKYGGHVGFTTFASDQYWNEYQIVRFFNQY